MEIKSVTGKNYDVIVIGGGPSGSAAAIAAGRAGADTLLIEKNCCLGGMWTSGFVTPLFDYKNKDGILREIISELDGKGAWGGFWGDSFNFEYMKYVLENMCADAGVTLLYDTTFIGVKTSETDGVKKAEGVYVSGVEGVVYYGGRVIIDCSGDAAVVSDMGLPCLVGDENDGSTQAATLMFLVGGVPEKYRDGVMIYGIVEEAFKKEGKGRHLNFDKPFFIPIPNSDFALFQLTHMHGLSPTSSFDRTKAAIEGRKQMIEVFEALRKFDPDFAKCSLIASAPMLGVRESRRIVGEYTLTEDDLLGGAQFDDGVCTVAFGVDIHPAKGEKQVCVGVKPYGIPFRCMLPKNSANVVVAGKTISGTHFAMASYRVTGNCAAMGEAAGKAAALSAKTGVPLREMYKVN